jgi:hypothetical protein
VRSQKGRLPAGPPGIRPGHPTGGPEKVSDVSETTPPPRPRADHRNLSRTVLFYAMAVSALLVGVAALLFGIAWSDLADAHRW